MKRDLPPYVYPKGKRGYLYFTRRGTTQRLPAIDHPEFWTEYAKAKRGIARVPKGKTFAALIADYKRSDRFARLKPRTRQDYDKVLGHIESKVGKLDPSKMRRKHVNRARDDNREAVRFANYIVQVLSVLFEHAIDIGWMEQNPAKGVRKIKSTAKPRAPWPAELVQAYRDTARDRALLAFELCIGTGQRIGDVLKMKWSDIEGGGIYVSQGKTGARLWIPFTPHLQAAIDKAPKRAVFILTNQNATGPWSYRGASQAIRKVREEIGALAYDIHALRHTAASELAEAGCSDELIMAVTGHSSASMVKHYAGTARQRTRAIKAMKRRKDAESGS